MASPRTVHVRIEGRVQGIGFRWWTVETARGLGLDGWVRNRRDGAVEAVFSGAAEAVEAMLARCREGPRGADVREVVMLQEGGDATPGFEVRPTV